MDLRKTLLLLLLICVLTLEAEAARPRGRQRGSGRAGGRGRVRGRVRGRGRGKGRHRVRKPTVSAAPERVPVYLELAGEEHPIPVYPLAPGSGHQPFTVRVASPHLDDPEPAESPRKPTSQVPSPFEPPQSGEKFSAADAGVSPDSTGSRPLTSVSNSLGAGFFESETDFGRSPPQFPSFDTQFDAVRSRRRGARRLFPPAEISGVKSEVSGVTDQLSPDADYGHAGSETSPGSVPSEEYQYGYLVDGRRVSGAAFGLQESSADGLTRGRYEVRLPDGRTQVVTYTAGGRRGYEADVTYIGQADTGAANGV